MIWWDHLLKYEVSDVLCYKLDPYQRLLLYVLGSDDLPWAGWYLYLDKTQLFLPFPCRVIPLTSFGRKGPTPFEAMNGHTAFRHYYYYDSHKEIWFHPITALLLWQMAEKVMSVCLTPTTSTEWAHCYDKVNW